MCTALLEFSELKNETIQAQVNKLYACKFVLANFENLASSSDLRLFETGVTRISRRSTPGNIRMIK